MKISAAGYKVIYFVVTDISQPSITLPSAGEDVTVEVIQPVRHIYTTVPASLNLSSADVVYSANITKNPVVSFRNALSGRLAGLYTQQALGLPGSDGAFLSLRGQTPNVIIDGVVANLTSFDLEEIESITVAGRLLLLPRLPIRG